MYFYVAFHFFKVPFDFYAVPKRAFCKAKVHRGTPKGAKMSFSFSLIKWHFFMYFYVPFHFFKVFFKFASVAKAAFCKSKAHRGTPKVGKMSLVFFSNETAFFHAFLRAISFFQSFFNFASVGKAAFCKS